MKNKGRYSTEGMVEGDFEPGCEGLILKNLQGINDLVTLDKSESEALLAATDKSIDYFDAKHCFTAKDICYLHHEWLNGLYSWAGQYRKVNVSKDGFPFAAARLVPQLMEEFECNELRQYTPCIFSKERDVINALAVKQCLASK